MPNKLRLYISGERVIGEWTGPKSERLTQIWGTNVLPISGINYCSPRAEIVAFVQSVNPGFEVFMD